MPLLRLDNVSLAYGHVPLLAHVDFQIERGERVCLLGRNGAGKTTFLRLITGVALPDEGDIWRHDTLRIAHLEQEVPPDTEETIYEVVAAGLGELGALLTEYHQVTHDGRRGGAHVTTADGGVASAHRYFGWLEHQSEGGDGLDTVGVARGPASC